MLRMIFLTIFCVIGAYARADGPRVTVDIAPVHSLVSLVMHGVGEPELILQPGSSPHAFAIRPELELALQQSDLVIWMGPGLTPSLSDTIDALSREAQIIDLMHQPETLSLPLRNIAVFDSRHDDQVGHKHGEQAQTSASTLARDPHAWLDPENARIWVATIADALVYQDPENAALYRQNAALADAELSALVEELDATLAPVRGRAYLVYHDAYHYFEARFGLTPAGAITSFDATPASAARLRVLIDLVEAQNVVCVLTEPQFSSDVVGDALGAGLTVGQVDPLGSRHEPGPALYAETLRDMAQMIALCTEP